MNYQQFLASITQQEREIVAFYRQLFIWYQPQRVLEVGSGWGLFSRSAVESGIREIITIDKIGGYGLDAFNKNLEGYMDKLTRIEADSQVLLPTWEKDKTGYFDLIFVDADHGLIGAGKDIKHSWPLLKPGGVMLIDDCFHKENFSYIPERNEFNFGVTQALWGFIQAHSKEFKSAPTMHNIGHGVVVIEKK